MNEFPNLEIEDAPTFMFIPMNKSKDVIEYKEKEFNVESFKKFLLDNSSVY